MNGAESLVRTLVNGGVNVCFSNPGTSEMHFVAALDRVEGMRCVLALFEGVATGAADGYARMAEKPAATLLHLGPGLANGLANLHNASKASTPVVNIVGDHATYHRQYDAPLTSDIETAAQPFSGWVRTSPDAKHVAADGAAAIAAAMTPPGQVATLILPGDTAWDEGTGPAVVPPVPQRARVSEDAVKEAARVLRSGEPAMLLLTGPALREKGLELAARIAAKTGAKLMAQTFNRRMERGAGRISVERIPYPVEQALERARRREAHRAGRQPRAGGVLRLSGQAERAGARGLRSSPRWRAPKRTASTRSNGSPTSSAPRRSRSSLRSSRRPRPRAAPINAQTHRAIARRA